MATMKPSIPKGTRDFTPTEMMRRNYIFQTIRTVFENHAYLPIETPAIENLCTLMGKYGEEGDRLLFKILNSGDFTEKVDFAEPSPTRLASQICEKGLRYDLTVPFARFVVQHQNEIVFPFKRYQMQPVWRADRPQKGRYREFYQCDADVIGSESLLNEAELMQITFEIFQKFGIDITIKVNNRKILSGIAEIVGESEKVIDICTAIDKLDKIGKEKVCQELMQRGLSEQAIEKLQPFFDFCGDNDDKIELLDSVLAHSEIGHLGVDELRTMLQYAKLLNINNDIEIDITLARGLNYYTGAIFEVKAKEVSIGSISGGGRYDNLTGIFGLKNMSGVGISYGAERIYDVLEELQLFPPALENPIQVLFVNFGEVEEFYALPALQKVRRAGITAEIYPDHAKIGKQMTYANNKGIPFVIMAGEDEMQQHIFTLKNMKTGKQEKLTIEDIISEVK
ncbi:MAG TPA: histidine--tRNA ligase [Bacteroidales bacterium]|nr:histidine--tRNA ligase [Bacteroidales bacterium]HPT52828.1 histidine--tRNA ligase [Bacteroidales bacterium]